MIFLEGRPQVRALPPLGALARRAERRPRFTADNVHFARFGQFIGIFQVGSKYREDGHDAASLPLHMLGFGGYDHHPAVGKVHVFPSQGEYFGRAL